MDWYGPIKSLFQGLFSPDTSLCSFYLYKNQGHPTAKGRAKVWGQDMKWDWAHFLKLKTFFLQLAGPTSSAVSPGGSVCLRPGVAMGKPTVWTAAMNSSVPPSVDQARCLASVATSVWTTSSCVTGRPTAGTPRTRASTTVVRYFRRTNGTELIKALSPLSTRLCLIKI